VLRHHHGGQRGDQEKLNDPGLRQGDVGTDGRPPGTLTLKGLGLGGHFAQPTTRYSLLTKRETPVRLIHVPAHRSLTVSRSLSHRLNVLALGLIALIVLTGGAVRLTGSGLGCSDWPECSVGHLTPALQFHGLVEFGNRMVTVVLTIAVAASFLGCIFREPRRRDLVYLSGGLVVGVLSQAVLGGIVVYTKLNPYVVMVHFVATMFLLVDAVVLVHRDQRDYSSGSARLLIPRPLLRLFYGLLALLTVVITAGTATSGAGPHAGDASGQQVAKRIPIALRDMAEIHSSLALLLVGVTIGLVVGLHLGDVPERVRRAGRILLAVMVAQAAVGYTQYFTHLPALLVEVHLAGATALVIGSTQCFLACTFHRSEVADSRPAPAAAEVGVPINAR
jgi:heme a synthase